MLVDRNVPHAQIDVFTVPAAAGPAPAQYPRDWYLSAVFGWNYADAIALDSIDAEVELDRGNWRPSVALGVKVYEDWRVELGGAILESTPEIVYSSSNGRLLIAQRGLPERRYDRLRHYHSIRVSLGFLV